MKEVKVDNPTPEETGKRKRTTRDKILASGKRMFLEMGFEKAPLRKIVAEAGFTQGAFYGYFNTKEDLFYALTDELVEKIFALLEEILAEIKAFPPEQRILEMSNCYLRHLPELAAYLATHQAEFKLVVQCSRGTKHEQILEDLAQENLKQLKESLQVLGGLSEVEEKLLGILIRGYFSMVAQIILEHTEAEMLQMMRGIQTVFEAGIWTLFSKKSF